MGKRSTFSGLARFAQEVKIPVAHSREETLKAGPYAGVLNEHPTSQTSKEVSVFVQKYDMSGSVPVFATMKDVPDKLKKCEFSS